jgi:hypothetical protein
MPHLLPLKSESFSRAFIVNAILELTSKMFSDCYWHKFALSLVYLKDASTVVWQPHEPLDESQ